MFINVLSPFILDFSWSLAKKPDAKAGKAEGWEKGAVWEPSHLMLGNSRTVALALGVIVYRTREAGSNGSVRFSLVLVLVPIRPPLKNFMYLVSPVHRVPVQYPASINSNTPILRWSLTTVSNELMRYTWEFWMVLTLVSILCWDWGTWISWRSRSTLVKSGLVTDRGRWKDLGLLVVGG